MNSAGKTWYESMIRASPSFKDDLRQLFPHKSSRIQVSHKPEHMIETPHARQLFFSTLPSEEDTIRKNKKPFGLDNLVNHVDSNAEAS